MKSVMETGMTSKTIHCRNFGNGHATCNPLMIQSCCRAAALGRSMVAGRHFRYWKKVLAFIGILIAWIALLWAELSNRKCRRCHFRFGKFYLVSVRQCGVQSFWDVLADRYNGFVGIGLSLNLVILVDFLVSQRKEVKKGRRLDAVRISRRMLVFAGAFSCWLFYLRRRATGERCIRTIANFLNFEIVVVQQCSGVNFSRLLSNKALTLFGVNISLITVVLVDVAINWWIRRKTVVHRVKPAVPSLEASTFGSLEHFQSMPSASSSGSHLDPFPSLASPVSVDSATLDLARDSVRGMDSILEALDESNGEIIFQPSFGSSVD